MVSDSARYVRSESRSDAGIASFVPAGSRSSFEALALAQPIPMTTGGPMVRKVQAMVSRSSSELGFDPSWSGIFRNPAGRFEAREGRVSEVILSHAYWQGDGGDPPSSAKRFQRRASAGLLGNAAGFRGLLSVDVCANVD